MKNKIYEVEPFKRVEDKTDNVKFLINMSILISVFIFIFGACFEYYKIVLKIFGL